MFIVSGAVGAFVLIIIMTGIFIYLIKTKSNKAQQVTQSPTPYGPNMQGNDFDKHSFSGDRVLWVFTRLTPSNVIVIYIYITWYQLTFQEPQ